MLKHDDIWRAIDTLASRHGLTASGLARKAGLDPTTFNKSKRVTASGRRRWPSTESLAKALGAVGTSLNEFVGFVEADGFVERTRSVPAAGQSRSGIYPDFGDTGEPKRTAWNPRQLPEVDDPDAYAIAVEGDAYRPVLRGGARVVAAPHAPKGPGDRVVVRMASAELVLAELVREDDGEVEIRPLTGGEPQLFKRDEVAAVHRIVWAEQ